MNRYLHTTDGLEFVDYDGPREVWVFDLDELPKKGYSISDVYDLFEGWSKSITPCTAGRIVLKSETKSKTDCLNLFFTFMSICSKQITGEQKEGEKRLAPRTQIMDDTMVDLVTMKQFLNYKCMIEYLQVELYRKGKSFAAL